MRPFGACGFLMPDGMFPHSPITLVSRGGAFVHRSLARI
jgi:hypothetical protein